MALESPKKAGLQLAILKSKDQQLQSKLDPKQQLELVLKQRPPELVPHLATANVQMLALHRAKRINLLPKEVSHQ